MNNQFFYTDRTRGGEAMASFNINKVIRSLEITPGTLTVILDDFHSELRPTEVFNGKKAEVQNRNLTVQSEIQLSGKDMELFKEVTNCLNTFDGWEFQGYKDDIDSECKDDRDNNTPENKDNSEVNPMVTEAD